MPTSATPICNGPASVPGASRVSCSHRGSGLRQRKVRGRGFTLLEILVVLVLVAVLSGTVILGFTGADVEQRLRGSVGQLVYRLELARQYALQRNREWGIYVEEDRVRFSEYDPEQDAWIEQGTRPFGAFIALDGVALRVEAEGAAPIADSNFLNLDADRSDREPDFDRLPDLLLFSSGEVTPFTIYLEPSWNAPVWRLASDGLSPVGAEREGE